MLERKQRVYSQRFFCLSRERTSAITESFRYAKPNPYRPLTAITPN